MSSTDPSRAAPVTGSNKMVIVAVVLGLAAVIMTNLYIGNERSKFDEESFVVYRMKRKAPAGYKLREGDFDAVRVPNSFSDAFKDALNKMDLENKIHDEEPTRRPVFTGSVISHELWVRPDEDPDQIHNISQGKRLVSLPINSRIQPGSLKPGMYVDIAAPFSTSGNLPEVMLVMEYVQVVAVGRQTVDTEASSGRAPVSYQTISIELTPEQAAVMSMVQKLAVGDFELYLRNPADDQRKLKEVDYDGINRKVVREVEKRIGRRLFAEGTP